LDKRFGSNPTLILGRGLTGINAGQVTRITKVILTTPITLVSLQGGFCCDVPY